jgi:hypothetical protein
MPTKDKDHVELSRCVGKITAYRRVGSGPDAKIWAWKLVEQLVKMKLLPDTVLGS